MIDRKVNGGFNTRKVLNGQDFSICFHADILILILMLWQDERELHVRQQNSYDKQEIAITS
jgi:hypothetical protein